MKAYYPGSFNPPTYGHLEVLREACKMLDEVTVVCSTNPEKHYQLTQEERKEMWLKGYDLPQNCTVKTFDELAPTFDPNEPKIMVRGVRSEEDLEDEMKVIEYNRRKFGFQHFVVVYTDDSFHGFSSSACRAAAGDLDFELLSTLASPHVVGEMLKQALKVKSLWLVVGPPAGGKTTLLKSLSETDPTAYVVVTDSFNHHLKPVLEAKYPGTDLVKMTLEQPVLVAATIKDAWFRLLKLALKMAPAGSNIFIECAYGLCPDKQMYRFLGSNILYVGCELKEHRERNEKRDTPNLSPFFQTIPGLEQSRATARAKDLRLNAIDSSGSTDASFNKLLEWYQNAQKKDDK